jgi:hypothetical protein
MYTHCTFILMSKECIHFLGPLCIQVCDILNFHRPYAFVPQNKLCPKIHSFPCYVAAAQRHCIVFYTQVCVGLLCLAGGWCHLPELEKQRLLYSGGTITGKRMWLLQRTFIHDNSRKKTPTETRPGGSTFPSTRLQRTHSQST